MASVSEDRTVETSPTTTTMPPKFEPNSTHPAFDSPDADLDLVSRDLVHFRMHSFTMKTTSGWFRTLFTLPVRKAPHKNAMKDCEERPAPIPVEPETIHLDEDASTLEPLFRMISGLPIQPLTSFDDVDAVLFAADKYEMPGPISLVRMAVLTPPLSQQPLRLYSAASRCGWTEEAKIASRRTLSMNLWHEKNWEVLSKVDVRSALALLKLHRARRDALRKKLDEHPFVNSDPTTNCSRCKRPADHHTWRELKNRIVLEMDSKPSGETILDVGLSEWPEAKACWESKCPHADCVTVQYDKEESVRLIKQCIDSLPATT